MRISVIIPSYNQKDYIEQALCSIISQDYPDKEIIVVDGGSEDGSVDIIRKHSKTLSFWCSEVDSGQSDAIAKGFKIATGELIGWLNSDDLLLPNALSHIAYHAKINSNTNAVFHGGFKVINELGDVMDIFPSHYEPEWTKKLLGPSICQPGSFFGRRAYINLGGINTDLKYGMDRDLWLRFFEKRMQFIRIPQYLSLFRRHGAQKGHSPEWHVHNLEERQFAITRYNLAKPGTVKYILARANRKIFGLVTGARLKTLAYRLAVRRTFKEYHPLIR